MPQNIIFKSILDYNDNGVKSTLYYAVDEMGNEYFTVLGPDELWDHLINMN